MKTNLLAAVLALCLTSCAGTATNQLASPTGEWKTRTGQLAYHDPKRLKICANTYCRGIFYDESKSRTKLYCTPEKCANLWKARRYRARHTNKL